MYAAVILNLSYKIMYLDDVFQLQVVRDHYGHFAREEATLRIKFERSEITLDIPVDGRVTREGWKIIPRSYPTVSDP